jgi:type IV pilus assembly protein PilE
MRTDKGGVPSARRMRGISMLELLTVVAIVAILSSIAVQSYRSYLLRAHRTDATTSLLRIQVAEEKYFLQYNTYTTDLTATGLGVLSPTQNGYYTLAVGPDPAVTPSNIATSFLATATPAGGQVKDKACPTLTINDQGLKGPAATATTCWK